MFADRVHGRAALPALALALLLAFTLGLAPKAMAEPAGEKPANDATAEPLEISTIDELSGKTIGMVSGAAFDALFLKRVEGSAQEDIMYFNSNAEAVGALMAGKIDAFITDSPIAELAVNKNSGIGIVPEYLQNDSYGLVLAKNSPLTPKINERLIAYRKDGTLDALKQKWMDPDESIKTMPEEGWDAPNGTLTVATTIDNEPMNYLKDNRMHGLSAELVELLGRDLGYGIEFSNTNVAALIAEVQSNKADMVADSLSITEERKKMVDMTEPYYEGGVTVVVRTVGGATTDQGLLEGLTASFERTFIVEDRWQLILGGLGVTLLIAIASGAVGLALGFLFVLLRRKKEGGLADKLIGLLESLMSGLPVIVVLMVFYYVVFGSISISGIIVAILVFTLMFGTATGSIMWNAIRAVDVGQVEAGRALGFSDNETFFRIVLPQAARQFAPLLVGQFISLIKDTAVVGYIAVQDLTRVGDLIRARTMEAFFPLIAIAIIYFIFCRISAWLLNKLAKKLEPKEEPRTIKGVKLQ